MKIDKIERKKFRVRNKIKRVAIDRYRISVNRSSKNISAQIIDDTKNITLAYASSDLVCKIKHIYRDSPLQLASLLVSTSTKTECSEGISTSKDISRKCIMRYKKRKFLEKVKHHPHPFL